MFQKLTDTLLDNGIEIVNPEKAKKDIAYFYKNKNPHHTVTAEDILPRLGYLTIIDWKKYIPEKDIDRNLEEKFTSVFKEIVVYGYSGLGSVHLEPIINTLVIGKSLKFLGETKTTHYILEGWDVISLFVPGGDNSLETYNRLENFILHILEEKNPLQLIKKVLFERKKLAANNI